MVRRANHDGIDSRIREQLFVILVALGFRHVAVKQFLGLLLCRLHPLNIGIRKCDKGCQVLVLPDARDIHAACDASAADDADLNLLRRRFCSEHA